MSGTMRTSSGQVRDSTVCLKLQTMNSDNDAFRHCTTNCTMLVMCHWGNYIINRTNQKASQGWK